MYTPMLMTANADVWGLYEILRKLNIFSGFRIAINKPQSCRIVFVMVLEDWLFILNECIDIQQALGT